MKAIDQLVSVLCDQNGKCCIHGSETDRQIVDDALAALRTKLDTIAQPVHPALVECWICRDHACGSQQTTWSESQAKAWAYGGFEVIALSEILPKPTKNWGAS